MLHGVENLSRGYQPYTSIKKVETNLYEIQKQSKLALLLECGKELIGRAHQGTLWSVGVVLYLSRAWVTGCTHADLK